jgi:hypothetical protein
MALAVLYAEYRPALDPLFVHVDKLLV